MGLTNPGGVGTTALEFLRGLAHAAGTRLREHLQPLVEGVWRRVTAGSPGARRPSPAGAASQTRTGATPEAVVATFGGEQPARPAPPRPSWNEHDVELPRAYGQSRAVLVARDPWWLVAWWEIPPVRRVEALRALGADGEGAREVLRVYVTGGDTVGSWDVELEPGAERAHVHVERPGRACRVEIGLRTAGGRFVSLVTSNVAVTPPAQPSRDTTVEWVALSREGQATVVPGDWSGRRVPTPTTDAGRFDEGVPPRGATPSAGSSDTLPVC